MHDGKLLTVPRPNCCWKHMPNKRSKGCEMICINIYTCIVSTMVLTAIYFNKRILFLSFIPRMNISQVYRILQKPLMHFYDMMPSQFFEINYQDESTFLRLADHCPMMNGSLTMGFYEIIILDTFLKFQFSSSSISHMKGGKKAKTLSLEKDNR